MSPINLKQEPPRPYLQHRKGLLSLRWQLIILASSLTVFSYAGETGFSRAAGIAIAFALSNVCLSLVPARHFEARTVQTAIAAMDFVFVAATLYLLRVPETYLYVPFLIVFVLAAYWRDLRLVLFSLFAISILFGLLHSRLFQFDLPDGSIARFLAFSLFFVVSIFYVFLAGRMKLDGLLAAAFFEEKRNAALMVEITRGLASSLNSNEVLFDIVSRLSEFLKADVCSIIRVDPKTGGAQILVNSSDSAFRAADIDFNEYPELKRAYETRKLVVAPAAQPVGVIGVPMIAQESVLGVIHVRSSHLEEDLSEATVHLFDVVANTAANALRNAQLFEEVEHRARTDFLTGLPNHRFFQESLSVEMGKAVRHNHPLSLLIIDLDFLKTVNDRFGHPSGDTVIRTIADTIRNSCREIDFAARYGGEEFMVILPETPLTGAMQVADRIRERIAATELPGIGSITASIGVSNYPVNALSKEDLIRIADQALYVAKNAGRNRVSHFSYQMITK